MKASSLLLVLTVSGLLVLVFIHITLHINHHVGESTGEIGDIGTAELSRLLSLVKAQNVTITALSGMIESSRRGNADSTSLQELVRKRDMQIRQLKDEIAGTGQTQNKGHNSSLCSTAVSTLQQRPPTGIDEVCESLYGLSLVDSWRNSAQTWCESTSKKSPGRAAAGADSGSPSDSKLVCYPYLQMHKRNDGRGPDMFCYATNFFIDFSKVTGQHAMRGKPPAGQQYFEFESGSLFSTCKPTSHFRPMLFMPHHALQMGSFKSESSPPKAGTFTVEEASTYLLARDEDCENSFHSTADFMNMHLVMLALGLSPAETQVMLFDRHSDGPYFELLQRAFSGGRPPIRKEKYGNGKVLFRKLVFHLESPAGLIFPKVYNLQRGGRPEPLRCFKTGLFTSYSRFVLDAFGLWDVPPPPIPQVTLSLRHRTETKNVGRILANEQEVISVLKEGNMMNLDIVDTSKMAYSEQLALIRKTNVLVGVHGAGLMLIMFAANEAVLVELHPSYRQDRHFRHAARMVGRNYLPLRSNVRETCHGSSDNVVIPVDEFRKTMDGALRLARNFDDGISECGLFCPLGLLDLDTKLKPFYKSTEVGGGRRRERINTDFPC